MSLNAKEVEVKAETPIEKGAFRLMDLMMSVADISATIKDDASLADAQKKMTNL